MKLLKSLLVCSLFVTNGYAQVSNGNFESGGINYYGNPASFNMNVTDWIVGCSTLPNGALGSPDIFDEFSVLNCQYDVPNNKFSPNRTVNIPGSRRYIGFNSNENIIGKLTEPLSECNYEISFALSPIGSSAGCGGSTLTPGSFSTQLQFRLLNSASLCNGPSSIIYTSPVINLTSDNNAPWTTIVGTFTPTAAQVAGNFDRIEVHTTAGQMIYFDDLTITKKDCCPPIELVTHCDDGTINITGIPANSTGVYTNWYKRKKLGAYQLLSSSNGIQSSIQNQGSGTYLVQFQIVLANGEVCTYSETITYSVEDCCQETGPTLSATLLDDVLYYETVYSSTYGWSVQVPVICNLDPHRIVEIAINSSCIDYYNYTNAIFDPNTWTNQTVLKDVSGSGNPPSYLQLQYNILTPLGQFEVAPEQLNHFQIQTQSPYQVVDLLYIPTTICGKSAGVQESEINSAKTLAVYPNPGRSKIVLSLNSNSEVNYTLSDIAGRVIQSGTFIQELELNVENLISGTYVIKAFDGEQSFCQKWVKE